MKFRKNNKIKHRVNGAYHVGLPTGIDYEVRPGLKQFQSDGGVSYFLIPRTGADCNGPAIILEQEFMVDPNRNSLEQASVIWEVQAAAATWRGGCCVAGHDGGAL